MDGVSLCWFVGTWHALRLSSRSSTANLWSIWSVFILAAHGQFSLLAVFCPTWTQTTVGLSTPRTIPCVRVPVIDLNTGVPALAHSCPPARLPRIVCVDPRAVAFRETSTNSSGTTLSKYDTQTFVGRQRTWQQPPHPMYFASSTDGYTADSAFLATTHGRRTRQAKAC